MTAATATGPATALVDLRGGGEAEADWAALAERCASSPFLHPGVVRLWAEAFGGGPLSLLTVRRDGELVAALPLLRERRRISSPGNWHTVETGIVGDDPEAVSALARALFELHPRRLSLTLLEPATARVVAAEGRAAGYRLAEREMIASPYLELTGDHESLLAGWPSKRRAEHRRRRRRLAERGELTFSTTTDGAAVGQLLEELVAIERRGWKAAQGTAIAQHEETVRFYSGLARWAAERGWLRFHALRLDGRPLAMSLGLEAHGVFYGVKMGSDPAESKFAPGVLLVDDIVRSGFEQGLQRIEMLGDDDQYKRQWCQAARERLALDGFAPSLGGRAEHAATAYGRPLAARARALLARRRASSRPAEHAGAPG